jgi:hypothetical protein
MGVSETGGILMQLLKIGNIRFLASGCHEITNRKTGWTLIKHGHGKHGKPRLSSSALSIAQIIDDEIHENLICNGNIIGFNARTAVVPI